MSEGPVRFDDVFAHVIDTLGRHPKPQGIECICVVRDLYGKVRIAVADALEENEECRSWLEGEARSLCERLGPYGHPPEDAVLFLDDELMEELHRDAREVRPGVYWIERLLTGRDWWTVNGGDSDTDTYTLYSVKGGVGRSTSAAVLSWHLARRGEDVLVVDLDLESPGISSAMLDPSRQPESGVVDWFDEVEFMDVKLPPSRIEEGPDGVRRDLESLHVFLRMHDGRVNVPDVFRIGYGLGRRGGVRPDR